MDKTGSLSAMGDMDTKRLVREERARVQKVKNREAAQKSRDMKKGYLK